MAVIIYGRKSSANVQKVIWICTEVGVKIETRDIGGKYGGNKSDNFLNINPNGILIGYGKQNSILKHFLTARRRILENISDKIVKNV